MSSSGLLYPNNDDYLRQIKDRGYFILVDRNAKNISLIPGGEINNILAVNNTLLFVFGKNIAGTRQDIIDALYLSGLKVEDINSVISFGISVENINTIESQQWINIFHKQNITPQVAAPKQLTLVLATPPQQNFNVSQTRVVCVKVKDIRPKYNNLEEWTNDPNNVYIGRSGVVFIEKNGEKYRFPKVNSIWANPFKITGGATRESVINMYRSYIVEKLNRGEISREQLLQLKGKTLGCWCKEGGENIPCHGDVLIELLNSIVN